MILPSFLIDGQLKVKYVFLNNISNFRRTLFWLPKCQPKDQSKDCKSPWWRHHYVMQQQYKWQNWHITKVIL